MASVGLSLVVLITTMLAPDALQLSFLCPRCVNMGLDICVAIASYPDHAYTAVHECVVECAVLNSVIATNAPLQGVRQGLQRRTQAPGATRTI